MPPPLRTTRDLRDSFAAIAGNDREARMVDPDAAPIRFHVWVTGGQMIGDVSLSDTVAAVAMDHIVVKQHRGGDLPVEWIVALDHIVGFREATPGGGFPNEIVPEPPHPEPLK